MNHLDSTSKSWQIVLAGARTTNDCPFVASWVDMDLTAGTPTFAPVEADGTSNGTSAVTVVAAPASNHQIQIKSFSLFNADTASVTATVRLLDSATGRVIVTVALPVGFTLQFTDPEGWKVTDTNGAVLGTASSGGITQLTSDVTAGPGSGSQVATIAANAVTTSKINNAAVTLAKIANASNNSRWVGSGSGGSGSAYTENTFGDGLTVGGSSVSLTTNVQTRVLLVSITGNGSTITTGIVKGADAFFDFSATITKVTMLADQSGSIVVDIWKAAYGSYPPTVANTITASDLPTITSATKSQDSTLTGWTTSISAGDVLRFNVNSVTSIQAATLALTLTVN